MSKPYEHPKAQLAYFAVSDIITASSQDDSGDDIDWGIN